MLWSPRADPAVIILASAPAFLAVPTTELRREVGPSQESHEGHYALLRGAPHSQLLMLSAATEDIPLTAVIPLDAETLTRVEALSQFWRALRRRPIPADTRVTKQQRRRLRLMMQAIDGRSNDASYREIAIAIYGRERVASQSWKTSALRDAIIGLVEGATDMIGGGYRKLLRHRRRK